VCASSSVQPDILQPDIFQLGIKGRTGRTKAVSSTAASFAVELGSSIGAGAAKSLGRKIRALTASMAIAKISTMKNGATYDRRKDIIHSTPLGQLTLSSWAI
jgi:hypothetical protein